MLSLCKFCKMNFAWLYFRGMQILTFFTLICFHGLRNSDNFAWIYYHICQIHVFCGERTNNLKTTEAGLGQ